MKKSILILIFVSLNSWSSVNLQFTEHSSSFNFESIVEPPIENENFYQPKKFILGLDYFYTDKPLIVKNDANSINLASAVNAFRGFQYMLGYKIKPTLLVDLTGAYLKEVEIQNESTKSWLQQDSKVSLNWTFFNKNSLAISIKPSLTFTNGDKANYLGNSNITFGGSFFISKTWEKLMTLAGLGYFESKGAVDSNDSRLDYSKMGLTELGLAYKFSEKWLTSLELKRLWSIPVGNDINPNEVLISGRYLLKPSWALFASAGAGTVSKTDSQQFRGLVGFKYIFPTENSPEEPKKVVPCEPKEKRIVLKDYVVNYANNKDIPYDDKIIKEMYSGFLKYKNETTGIAAVGHTSKVGSLDYNMSLSKRRAEKIILKLEAMGIPKGLMKFEWQAFNNLEDLALTETAHAKNRRVRVVFYKNEIENNMCQ